MTEPASHTTQSKRHYLILDGLRGVASLMVVLFHVCEANRPGQSLTQWINHGYLAVDFFFLLSGFVVAYAYDDRWSSMSMGGFIKRRLIRLQPMVVMGMLVGAAMFYFQQGPDFPLIAQTPVWQLMLVTLVGCTLLPLPVSMDIRGWQEMHPVDGPAWSLFFEYIANIAYALGLRKVSNRVLGVLVVLAAAVLVQLLLFGKQGDLIGGWSLTAEQLHIGFARLCFPFLAGMLLMRLGKRLHVRHAFALCSLLLVVMLSLPRFGGDEHRWINGLYEALCVIVVFPLIVALGAGASLVEGVATRVARFVGDLSYPLYITHYPLIYIYTEWVAIHHPSGGARLAAAVLVLVSAIVIALACLKLYDEPLRRWLARRFVPRMAG